MIHALFYIFPIIMVSSVSILFVSTNGMFINRTFHYMPNYVFKESVYYVSENGDYNPYFNRDLLEENVSSYLITTLRGRVSSFDLGFAYFAINLDGEETIDVSDFPKNVDIHMVCKYTDLFTFDSHRRIEIERLKFNE